MATSNVEGVINANEEYRTKEQYHAESLLSLEGVNECWRIIYDVQ